MSSSRRKTPLNTGLIRPKEDIEQEAGVDSRDMSSEPTHQPRQRARAISAPSVAVAPEAESAVRLKRASFDLRADQIERLGVLKYTSGRKMSELAQEAIDDLLAKYG